MNTRLHFTYTSYLLRLIIEATIAAKEAVEDMKPIVFTNPFPVLSGLIGTTIWHPASTFG